jgi:DNA-directed RNA polymerase subunit H (RpoH/RPB5)
MNEIPLSHKISKALTTLYEILIENRGYGSMHQIVEKEEDSVMEEDDGDVPAHDPVYDLEDPKEPKEGSKDTTTNKKTVKKKEKDFNNSINNVNIPRLFVVTRNNKKQTPSLLILIFSAEKLNIDGLKEMVRLLDLYQIRHGILVYHTSITSSAKKALDLLTNYRIESFSIAELQFNITKHEYYSPHEKVTDLSELGPLQTQTAKFPKILLSDPVVRFFGYRKNDVLRIRRKDNTVIYRVVR